MIPITTTKQFASWAQSLVFFLFLYCVSCTKQDSLAPPPDQETAEGRAIGRVSNEMVLAWNDAAIRVVTSTPQNPPNPPIPPFYEARYLAMVHLAMHDALNNIVPRYRTYALTSANKTADPNAAVAQAAHDVIASFYGKLNPPAFFTPQPVIDEVNQLLAVSLASVPDGASKERGIELGKAAAQAILQRRTNDGIAQSMYPIAAGTLPGQYRFAPPFDGPPFNGFYDSPGWGDILPFGITSSTQFSVEPPYAINSADYTADYNEVKRLGCLNCTGVGGRTQDQEDIAKFWVESSPEGWNKIARAAIAQRKMDPWKVARLLALLHMAEADGYIACLKAKITYYFWRPVTAIRLGDADGNPNTVGDPGWQELWFPTPPVADHPSAHATEGGAAAAVLADFFEGDDFSFSFESGTLPGKPRSFSRFSQAARENSLSRIYVGYHFRKACTEGELLGSQIGNWIATKQLVEKD